MLAGTVVAAALLFLPILSVPSAASGPTNNTFTCKVKFGSTPDALLIPNSGPGGSLAAGGTIGFQYQFQVLNFAASLKGHIVYLPTVTVGFSTTSGTVSTVDLKHNLTISNGSFSAPGASQAMHKVGSAVTFTSGATVTLSTQKLAVMANAGFGKIDLAFRWRWTEQPPGGALSTGAWTVPNSTAFHPSEFYAAPFVNVVSHTTSPVVLGTNYTATLSGAISKEPFFLELEFASSGHVVMSHGDTAPSGNTTPFPATILFNSYTGDLQPATMLVHVHNHCGSMLASITAAGVYASSATVTLTSSTSACSTIVFNGVHYSAGSTVTVKPSHTSIPISAPSCAGHTFSKWTATPDLRIITGTHASTSVIVTYTGTLEAHYS